MNIRPVTSDDAAAIQHICLVTGLAGGDATGAFGDDAAVADVYALPYLYGPAGVGFVVVGDSPGSTPVGYILGTADTRAFQEWFSNQWWTGTRAERTVRTADDAWLLAEAANPARMINEHVDDYPAHLHIDLLPDQQGRGWGRQLIAAFVEELARRSVAGVHLEASTDNAGAQAFYPRVGFEVLARTPHTVRWGRRLATVVP